MLSAFIFLYEYSFPQHINENQQLGIFMKDRDYLLDEIKGLDRNQLIIGPAGCGKSHLIKQISSTVNDIIVVAPSGIAALNIKGTTIQSFFGIIPYTYTINRANIKLCGTQKVEKILNAKILLIDEISMLRCEVLDIVDYKLRLIKKNKLPFGGLKLVFLGDPCQMEPVVQGSDENHLNRYYPDAGGDYKFYNSHVMVNNDYFRNSFDVYRLDSDYRHKDDMDFRDMLKDIRMGKISQKNLNRLNDQYIDCTFFREDYQYLTTTNAKAKTYNSYFLNALKGKEYHSKAEIKSIDPNRRNNFSKIKHPFYDELIIKENMKIIFVKNDNSKNGRRWVNGTIGIVRAVNLDPVSGTILSVNVEINGHIIQVVRDILPLRDIGDAKNGDDILDMATISQFPFIPAWAITIDKSQGLTLDKVAIVLEKSIRHNQMYVALSRAKNLTDIVFLERKLRASDIHLSPSMRIFLDTLGDRIISIANEGN
jgi:ATP-dependent exoDNAse (exonuclease V) alpha subunit